jgi:hypothetical protein
MAAMSVAEQLASVKLQLDAVNTKIDKVEMKLEADNLSDDDKSAVLGPCGPMIQSGWSKSSPRSLPMTFKGLLLVTDRKTFRAKDGSPRRGLRTCPKPGR